MVRTAKLPWKVGTGARGLAAATAIGLGLTATGPARAAEPPVVPVGAPNQTPTNTPDDSPLAGPKVRERTGEQVAASLVKRDFDGRIRRVEVDPAVAALEHLTLDAPTRERIDRVIFERNAIVDRIVQENLLTLADAAQAGQGGDKANAMKGLRTLMEAARPLRDRGRLIDEIAPMMPEDQAAEAKRLVREYWRAIVRERMEIGPPDEPGKKLNFVEASATEMLLALGQEGRNGFERTIGQQARNFEDLLKKLSLTPEQESKIRAAVQDSVTERRTPDGKGYAEPTGRDKLRNAGRFMEIYGMLNAEQRRILLQEMRSMRAYEPMGGGMNDGVRGNADGGKGSPPASPARGGQPRQRRAAGDGRN